MTPLVTTSQLPSASVSVSSISNAVNNAQLAAMYNPANLPYTEQLAYSLPPLSTEQQPIYTPPTLDPLGNPPIHPPWPYPMYHPYDSLPGYAFPGYGMALDASRRKNATREATSTLKAWLTDHQKNPYPTKGEKIMLAIITKMTLTQVSTWFANARRRLKKENKMTWEPRNKNDEDDDDDACDKDDKCNYFSDSDRGDCDEISVGEDAASTAELNESPTLLAPTNKPKIWSVDSIVEDKVNSAASSQNSSSHGKILSSGLSKGLHHTEGLPYNRPVFPHNPYHSLPVHESLLLYRQGLASSFPAMMFEGVPTGLFAPSGLSDFNKKDSYRGELCRPEALRPDQSRMLENKHKKEL